MPPKAVAIRQRPGTARRRLLLHLAVSLSTGLALSQAWAQELDLDLPALKQSPKSLLAPPKASGVGAVPLTITVSKTLYLPPAMYGQWNLSGMLVESNAAGVFNPILNDIWLLDRQGDQVVVENPTTGARAAVQVDQVNGDTASFHRVVPAGRNRLYFENPTITVTGDRLVGQSVNRIRVIEAGQVRREYYAVYKLQATRISGARTQFRPEEGLRGPDIEIEERR
jgi:hypothetical protein